MKFEADIIKEILDSRGHEKSSIHYQSECVEQWVKEVEGAYPKLCDYRPEWLNYSNENKIGAFPYVALTDVTNATVENVVPYDYKSAMLKGQTLVNIANKMSQNKETTSTNTGTSTNYGLILEGTGYEIAYPLIANKEYLIIEEWNIKSSDNILHTAQPKIIYEDDTTSYLSSDGTLTTLGVHKLVRKFIPEKNVKNFYFGLTNESGNTISLVLNYAMIVEYQQGMENWDIPYFEGMQSVKLPVLTTIGKNLIKDISYEQGSINGATGQLTYSTTRARTVEFIKLRKNVTYTFSVFSEQENVQFREFLFYSNANLDTFKNGGVGTYKKTFTYTPQDDEFCRIVFIINTSPEGVVDINSIQLQLEQGSTATTYEPYQSITLSTPSDLVLRGVGEVKDELNCLTGEVTHNIGGVVIDGSRTMDEDSNGVYIQVNEVKRLTNYDGHMMCDKLPVISSYHQLSNVENGVSAYVNADKYPGENWIYIKVNNSVDKNTVKTSGETIKPLFSGEIPVEAITQNLASFIYEEE